MIISHAYRFIFVKTNKTAGSSMEALLERYLQPGDMMTLRNEIRDDETSIKALNDRGIQILSRHNQNIGSHSPLIDAHQAFPESKDFFSFGILRDPFQRFVSAFRWKTGRKIKRLLDQNLQPAQLETGLQDLFLDFIQNGNSKLNLRGRNLLQSVSADGEAWCVNRIHRLEALDDLEKDLVASTGLQIDCSAMPRLKSDTVALPKEVNLFTCDAIRWITSQHQWELDALGYKVPPVADRSTAGKRSE